MASIRLYISLDSKKSNFCKNPLQFPPHTSPFPISRFLPSTGSCTITTSNKSSPVKISPIETELSERDFSSATPDIIPETINEGLIEQNQDFKRGIRKKYKGVKKKAKKKQVGNSSSYKGSGSELESEEFFVHNDELDVNYSFIESKNLGLEQCNCILKRLESCGSDDNTLAFFEWMRNNGKLQKNVTAYNLVLGVLGRRQDWETAEMIIREVKDSCRSELDFRVFNTLIFACSKRGNMKFAAKWFLMMLEFGVRPNIATFGVLMGLYQKGSNVEEAEFVFAQMRSFRIICKSAYSAMITIYTRLRLYEKAEEVIGLMREDKVVLNLGNWLVLLNAYSQRGHLGEAEKVLVAMQEAKFPPDVVAYNTLITGYGKLSNMVAAQRVFAEILNVGLQPNETTYRSMIEGWGRTDNYKEAEWYYKELKRSGFKPNSSNLYTMINLQAKHGDEEGAIRTVDDMLEIGCQYPSILGILLKAYEKAGRISKVPLLLRASFYEHVLVNQTSCSIVVMVYVKHGLIDDALKVLGDKTWNDPFFQDNLYHLLICSCKELGRLENAVEIYTQMPKSDSKPNVHISCTMIDIYSSLGLFSEGEKLYLKLKSSGTSIDLIGFSVVVRMYIKAGSLKDACAVLEEIEKQKDITPDIYLYRDMLRVYQQCGKTSKLTNLYYEILRSGVTWDQELYNCLINCCARALPVDELSRLFSEMLHRGFSPNTITFNVMLDVYGKAKLFRKARELFWMARKRGLVDVISYNTIIAAYGQNKDYMNMASTVQNMKIHGFSVSLEAYNCMLDAYGKEGQMESFRNVLERMKQARCSWDHYTYNIMMNIYGEKGWIDEVADVLRELRESGLGPDLYSYNTLIKAYGIAGMVEDAIDLVKEMREEGIEADKVTYTNLITALQRNDKYLEAVKWSLWMKQLGL
ncbi:pentatricopeptide repeat-containing protein At4g30825, chloroplastic [Euphorbia lathyris]|uniref:pentatricopeptide repeat-containing protein At4g30825, chloroplastic n=1 Tax=Euphorbia lathyris TaxID=212925 RepID=UPI003313ED00